MEFCEKLKELRKSRGLTQEELAELLFVSRTAVSKWESGRGYPNIDSLKDLSAFFSVPVDELIRSENAIMLAEKDKREAIRACVARICCAVDILSVTMLFIPLFNADSVPVLMLTGIPLWEKIIFIAIIGVTAFVGVCGLALLHFDKPRGQRCVLYAGMLLSVVGAVIFIAARQSYAAMLYLCFLIVKGFILLKER